MKITLIILSITLLSAFAGWQFYTSFYLAKTEQQLYSVEWTEGNFEVRHYPEAIMATVRSSDSTYKTAANRSFRVLAGYIFGGNERSQSIAMTAPVHMQMDESGSTMSFVMPASYTMNELPTPNDRGVVLSKVGEKYVAALRFGGWVSDQLLAEKTEELLNLVSKHGLEPRSDPWYMGYNPPFQLFNRRNEVAIEIERQ